MVYAIAHIRGGGELGKKWHDDGRMLKKKNTFTDFIAAAEHLVAGKYTSQDRLAIMGGSAGGLLMGAVTNMRPDLFKVVVAHVPFVDVINTMLDATLPLTVGEFEEWGNPQDRGGVRLHEELQPLRQRRRQGLPDHAVKSSYNDTQVMYWEPAKYVAKLRTLKTDKNPLLFHINMDPPATAARAAATTGCGGGLRLRVPPLAARRGEGGPVKPLAAAVLAAAWPRQAPPPPPTRPPLPTWKRAGPSRTRASASSCTGASTASWATANG